MALANAAKVGYAEPLDYFEGLRKKWRVFVFWKNGLGELFEIHRIVCKAELNEEDLADYDVLVRNFEIDAQRHD